MNPATLPDALLGAFLRRHRLPEAYRDTVNAHLLPLAAYLAAQHAGKTPLLVGVNGAQGTGKTTLADFLAHALPSLAALRTAVVSIDDFYLAQDERRRLASRVHPLLATRGVAGTHDVARLAEALDRLRTLAPGETLRLPRFDKAADDRAPEAEWRRVTGPVDVVVFEGWLVGSRPVPAAALEAPINALERAEDPDGRWRRYVNDRLAGDYAALFERIDRLVYLAAPSFEAVLRWRRLQEQKLAERRAGGAIMSADDVSRFVQYFERITRDNMARMPGLADAVLELDEEHRCTAHRFGNDA